MSLYYIDRESELFTQGEGEVFVVLGGALYWYRHYEIPTKSLSKAKKIAKHLMSERPSGYETFFLQRTKEGYDVYAYDALKIKERLKRLGVEEYRLFFANQAEMNTEVVGMDEKRVLMRVGGIVLEMPKGHFNPSFMLRKDYRALFVSKKAALVYKKEREGKNPLLVAAAAFFGLGVVIYGVDGAYKINKLNAKLEALRSDRSSYETEALIKKYERLQKSAKQRRALLSEKLVKGRYKFLEYNNGKFKSEQL